MEVSALKKAKLIVGLLIALAVLVSLGLIVYNELTFRFTGSNPSPNAITEISPFFDINFNKPLSSRVTVESTPNITSSYKINSKVISIVLPLPLNLNQTYTITVSNIYDTAGKHLPTKHFVFIPKRVPLSGLPKDQSQVLLNNQVKYAESTQNGLLRLLPFVGAGLEYEINYNINDNSQSSKLIIIITAPTPQAQQDALTWIKGEGYDPSKLSIQYVVGQPE